MISALIVLTISFVLNISLAENMDSNTREMEFCQLEFFNPKCLAGQLMIIESAKYGRMNLGKCIKEQELQSSGPLQGDTKFFGCQSDVTPILHEKCSFRQECKVEVRDNQLNQTSPCYSWIKSHLSVSYRCLNVFQTDGIDCRVMVSDKDTHLLIDGSKSSKCGDRNHPWLVEAHKGQTIRVTQLSFSPVDVHKLLVCSGVGALIVDHSSKNNMTICQEEALLNPKAGVLQESRMFKSNKGILKIFRLSTFDDPQNGNSPSQLLLKIEAGGCMDIIPPEDTWLKRTNDDVVVGCYSSKQTWYLRCENGHWSGSMGNCSQIDSKAKLFNENIDQKTPDVLMMSEESQILIIFAIAAFGVVVCLLIICCGFLLIKRYKEGAKFNPTMLESYYRKENQQTYPQPSHPYSYATVNNTMTADKRDNDKIEENGEDKYYILEESLQNKQ